MISYKVLVGGAVWGLACGLLGYFLSNGNYRQGKEEDLNITTIEVEAPGNRGCTVPNIIVDPRGNLRRGKPGTRGDDLEMGDNIGPRDGLCVICTERGEGEIHPASSCFPESD